MKTNEEMFVETVDAMDEDLTETKDIIIDVTV